MEYVLYCRKSSDDGSGKQEQSIPDQIDRCIKRAKENGVTIAKKPEIFSDFETEAELLAEDNDSDIKNRKICQESRNLFIIKESQSAKVPWKRPKRKKLIQYIKQGKVQWILSYSPDRQARNILEWGELINLVDENKIFLKYTNFHFENTASGKMMLGVWFVFAKQYSDWISENVNRWNEDTIGRGKALGGAKYGYTRGAVDTLQEWFYVPNEGFDLMKEAFQMKIYEHTTDVEIAQWLNDRGRTKKRGKKELQVTNNKLRTVWRDPFYYGKLVVSDYTSDQTKDNPHFVPMITSEEYEILADRIGEWKPKEIRSKIKDEYYEINGIPQLMLKSKDGYALTINLPSKNQRFLPKLEELKKTKPNASLYDVVKPNQIRFWVKQKLSKYNGLEVTFDILEKQIIAFFDKVKVSNKLYNEYVEFMKTRLQELYKKTSEELGILQVRVNDLRGQQTNYINKHMGIQKDSQEEKIYNDKKQQYSGKIERLEKEATLLRQSESDTIVKYEVFLDTLQRAWDYYKRAKYVQKAKICEIFFLNMVLDDKKNLMITPRPAFQALFENSISNNKKDSPEGILFGAGDETRTRNQQLGRLWL